MSIRSHREPVLEGPSRGTAGVLRRLLLDIRWSLGSTKASDTRHDMKESGSTHCNNGNVCGDRRRRGYYEIWFLVFDVEK